MHFAHVFVTCACLTAVLAACDDHVRAQPDTTPELTVDADALPELSPEPGPPPAIGPVLTLDEEAAKLEAALNSTCEPLLQLADSPWEPCRSADGWALPLAPVSIWGRSSTELWVGGNGTMLREGEGFRCVGRENIGKIEGNEQQVWARTEHWQNKWAEPILRWDQDHWVDSGHVANSVRVGPGDAVWFVSDGVVNRELNGEVTSFPSEYEIYDMQPGVEGDFWIVAQWFGYGDIAQHYSAGFDSQVALLEYSPPHNATDMALDGTGALWVAFGEEGEAGSSPGPLYRVTNNAGGVVQNGFQALHATAAGWVWAVGRFGFLGSWNGAVWQFDYVVPPLRWWNRWDLYDVWAEGDELWVAALNQGALQRVGAQWYRHGGSIEALCGVAVIDGIATAAYAGALEPSGAQRFELCAELPLHSFAAGQDGASFAAFASRDQVHFAQYEVGAWRVWAPLQGNECETKLVPLQDAVLADCREERQTTVWLVQGEASRAIYSVTYVVEGAVPLAGTSSTDLWIGDGTQLHHWDGLAWSVSEVPGVDAISGLEQLGELGLYLLAQNGAVLRRQGSEWVALGRDGAAPSTVLRAIVARAADDLWVGGDDGVYHWDGQRWTHEDAGGAVDGLWLAEDRIYARVDGRLSWKELEP